MIPRRFYINPRATAGETFGVFKDVKAACDTLQRFNRNMATHTIRKVESDMYIVVNRGYDKGRV